MTKSKYRCLAHLASATVLTVLSTGGLEAQTIEIVGSNATIKNGCELRDTPVDCASQMTDPLPASNPPSPWILPTAHTNGVVIGTNLSNSDAGAPVSGSLVLSGGGIIDSAYVYTGYEKNTEGSISISGAGSVWTSYSAGVIGTHGTGKFQVLDGGRYRQPHPDHLYIGYGPMAKGLVSVEGVSANGDRSTIDVNNRILVGNLGQGVLQVLDGGLVDSGYTVFIGPNVGSTGYAKVDGVNTATGYRSTLTTKNNNIQVGDEGHGVLEISNGAIVSVPALVTLGLGVGGDGTLTVDGVNTTTGDHSSLEAVDLRIGHAGRGRLSITNGAQAQGTGIISAGILNGSNGDIHVDGPESLLKVSVGATIGDAGQGTLSLTQNGSLQAPNIKLAIQEKAQGTINIGTGNHAGVLDTNKITGGAGTATVNFNHLDDVQFAPLLTGNIHVNQLNAGQTTLAADNDYRGVTTITDGALAAAGNFRFSANSAHQLDPQGSLMLNGYQQRVLGLRNGGVVKFGEEAGNTLYVTENYVGADGTLRFNAVLGDDSSLTDQLIVEGDTSGTTLVAVRNVDGLGAETVEGIEIVAVQGVSNGVFSLVGDYTHANGKDVVVAGAHAYQLVQGNQSGTMPNNWYLRSEQLTPVIDPSLPGPTAPVPLPTAPFQPMYQAGVPLYEAYSQVLSGLNGLSTWQQRVGSRSWSPSSTARVQGQSMTGGLAAPATEAPMLEGSGVWSRVEGWHSEIKPDVSTSDTSYDYDSFKIQTGLDVLLHENDQAKVIGGVSLHYVDGKANVQSEHGRGSIKTTGYGLGATVTWHGNNNVYVDNQAQVTWYTSDLHSSTARQNLVDGNNGVGYALSTEIGKRFPIRDHWSLVPQVQLTYSNVLFDDFNDAFGAHVSRERAASFQARLGLVLNYENSHIGAQGKTNRSNVYGTVNLFNDFLDGTKVNVSASQFTSRSERTWAGVGVGGVYNWASDRYSVYGEVSVKASLTHFRENYGYKGVIGFRARW